MPLLLVLAPGFDQQHRHAHCYVAERVEQLPAGIVILLLRPEEITPFTFLLPRCRGGSSGSTGPVRERSGVSTVVAGSGLDCETGPPTYLDWKPGTLLLDHNDGK